MTTSVQTEKMIYANEAVADEILATLQERKPEMKYHKVRVTSGWQVCPVTVLPPYMPGEPKLPAAPMQIGEQPKGTGDVLEYTFTFQRESQAWIWFDGADLPWIKKSHLISYELTGDQMKIRLSKELAAKIGLLKKVA